MSEQVQLRRKGGTDLCTTIDNEDYPELSQYAWYLSNNGYVFRYGKYPEKRTIYIHRQLLSAPKGMGVDHINGDTLDNRRCNLRLATQAQNLRNVRPRKNKTSRYKGVMWKEQGWRAKIQLDRRQIDLGSFPTQHEAALAYNHAAKELFGEFAWLNEIVDDPDDKPIQFPETQPSRFHGVCWDRCRQKWMAKIKAGNTRINIGRFADELEAAKAYDAAARIHHGRKAKLNFP